MSLEGTLWPAHAKAVSLICCKFQDLNLSSFSKSSETESPLLWGRHISAQCLCSRVGVGVGREWKASFSFESF